MKRLDTSRTSLCKNGRDTGVAMPNLSRIQIWAFVIGGGLVLALDLTLGLLTNFQALNYLKSHWIAGYYFAISPNTHAALLFLGLLMLGFAIFKLMQNPLSSEKPVETSPLPERPMTQKQDASSSVSHSGNPVIKDVGNPRVNIYTQPPPPKPQPAPKHPPEPRSNVSFKSARPAWIWWDDKEGIFVEVKSRDYASVRGVIARYKNESAAHGASEARYIRAELIFRDVNEQEMEYGVHAACWLREHTDTVDFEVGEDQWVFLGSPNPDDAQQWMVPRMQEKRTWQGPYHELQGHKFSGMRSVEVRIIGESNKWLTKPVIVDIVVNGNGEPTVAVRP